MKKVLFLHPWVENLEDMLNYLKIQDPDFLRGLTWDERDPDIVFVSEHVYYRPSYMRILRRLYSGNRLFIFHGGECVYPDLNIFDYAIVYSRYLNEDDRIIGIPEQLFFYSINFKPNDYSTEEALRSLGSREFCSFIYSNGNAHPMRDKTFYRISEYKMVSSLGRHLNNAGIQQGDDRKDWASIFAKSIELKAKYKFTIAFENALFPGGTTEKLLTSFMAHTVPIYWGNPRIADYYNPDAFINVHDFANLDEVVERVRELDQDDHKWAEVLAQPWQTAEQKKRSEEDRERYLAFLRNVLTQENTQAFLRRPEGFHKQLYRNWYMRDFTLGSYYGRAVNKIRRMFNRK